MMTLRGNLAEMAAVKHDLFAELIPNRLHNQVFHRDFTTGKILVLYSPWTDFQGELTLTLQKIRTIFGSCFIKLKNYNARYFKCFPIKKERIEEKILEIVSVIQPAIKNFIKHPDLPYINFLSAFSSKEEIQKECLFSFYVQKIKDFENDTHSLVPVSSLYQLALNQVLREKEDAQVRQWIKGLKINVHEFHRFLKRLIAMFPKEANLATLELALERRQCSIFQNPDKKVVNKIRLMKPGDPIQVKKKKYILGNFLSPPKKFPIYFALQDQPALMLVVDHNEAIQKMKATFLSQVHSGIKMPEIFAEEGPFSLIERCYHFLSEPSSSETLAKKKLNTIVELIREIAKLPFTPGPLLPDNFAFNYQGEMRCLTLMKPQVKSFEEIEIFAWKYAKTPSEFSYLMKESKLVEMPEAKAYQKLMRLALKGKEMDEAVSLGGKIKNLCILNYRKSFYLKVREIKAKLISEKSEENINAAIIECHLKHCPGHIFIPNFFELCKMKIN